jgi:cobalt-zinc-cadmium efflux system membrane fusion protein
MKHFFKRIFFVTCIAALFASCGSKKEEKPKPPATQSNPVKEGDLNTITLTDKAVERLGIKTFDVVDQFVGNSRAFSGEVVATPGKIITVTAPVAGQLMASKNGIELVPGQQVTKGQQIARLVILPSERDLLSVQADVTQREIQYNTAVEKVKRNTLLFEEKAGSLRAKQEAEAELAGIAAQLKVARNRLQLLKGNTTQALADRMSTLNLEAPISGVIQRVYSSTTQVLATAAPVVDIVSLSTLWIRVPVYAGDQAQINARENAFVRGLSDAGSSTNAVVARPVTGPQTSDPLSTSIDLYYEVDNSKGNFRPGQRISVTLPYKGTQSALVVPYSAILYDISGGTWVYENTAPRTFIRRRVNVSRVANGMAILQQGLAIGTKVVTDGAAELFGTEFGGGK